MKFTLWLVEIEWAQGLIHLRMGGEHGLTENHVQKKRQISVCLPEQGDLQSCVCQADGAEADFSLAILAVPRKERLGLKRKDDAFY